MNKAKITTGHYEWRWTQRHSCGCCVPMAILNTTKAFAEKVKKELSVKKCPKCELKDLLSNEEG